MPRRTPGTTPQPQCRGNLRHAIQAHGDAAETPITEEHIRRVLEMTGKSRDEDQLNCGACGYANCREKAIAVIRGMAEPEMCIPHMKRLAEQRVDRIIETSPNGIVILDEHLRILHMNPAFRKFFMCSDAVYGQPISYLMDPEPFVLLASGQESLIETVTEHERYDLVCHQILYPLGEERQYVGIFVNITGSRANQEQLDQSASPNGVASPRIARSSNSNGGTTRTVSWARARPGRRPRREIDASGRREQRCRRQEGQPMASGYVHIEVEAAQSPKRPDWPCGDVVACDRSAAATALVVRRRHRLGYSAPYCGQLVRQPPAGIASTRRLAAQGRRIHRPLDGTQSRADRRLCGLQCHAHSERRHGHRARLRSPGRRLQ